MNLETQKSLDSNLKKEQNALLLIARRYVLSIVLILYMSTSIYQNSIFVNFLSIDLIFPFFLISSSILLSVVIFKSLDFGILLCYFSVYIISTVSFIKFSLRGNPLYFTDLSFFRQISSIANFSDIRLTVTILAFFLAGILLIFLFKKFPRQDFKALKAFSGTRKILVWIFSGTYFIFAMFSNHILNLSNEGPISYFVNSATSNISLLAIDQKYNIDFENYNEQFLSDALAQIRDSVDENKIYSKKKPNVVVILSESFFDIKRIEGLKLSADPVKNFSKLQNESLTGTFMSSGYSGGTANIELEVVSGFLSKIIPFSETAMSKIDRPVMTLASIFKEKDYSTLAIHPYKGSFYNRKNKYPYLGYDKFIFSEDLENPLIDGTYISDSVVTDLIIENIEASDKPLFTFAITMENHMPYNIEKYPNTNYKVLNENFNNVNRIEAYLEGLSHADFELKRLSDYLSSSDEDTVLFFFGDHQPSLSQSFDVHKKLGLFEAELPEDLRYLKGSDFNAKIAENLSENDLKTLLSTDFIIWSNYKTETADLGLVGQNFLGNQLLDYVETEKPLFYHFLDEVYESARYFSRDDLFIDADEKLYSEMPLEYIDLINLYKYFEYDLMFTDSAAKKELETIVK